jgi:nucleotide-binding universal stress UspA family protein
MLVPVDLDAPEIADKALAQAKGIAMRDEGRVSVVSVQRLPMTESGIMPPDDQPRLDAYINRHSDDFPVHGVLRRGTSIAVEIRAAVAELGCDLIVMGSHEPRLSDYLFGSNAANVALHTNCSILIVR